MEEFATAFRDADSLLVLDIYAASEPPIPGVTAEMLADRVNHAAKQKAVYVASFAEAVALAAETAQPGEMILTLGAGSISQLGPQVLAQLATHAPRLAATE